MEEPAGACPRCGAAYVPRQEYCVECGLRLPIHHGFAPALGRAWRLQLSRHPAGWLWVVLCLLALATVAAAAAILASDEGSSAVRTIVATESEPVTAAPATATALQPTTPTTTAQPTRKTTTTPRRAGPVKWPPGRSGHTVVVASVPATRGRDAAVKLWRAAVGAGLPDVGILDSSEFASLRPGYYVVFSGFYKTEEAALAAVEGAQAKRYPRAYEREITP